MTLRRGVRLAIDVGTVRVGVARCDPDGVLASPVATLARDAEGADQREIVDLVESAAAIEVVVGHPKSLDGKARASARAATDYATSLAELLAGAGVPVRLVDERLTTTSAHRAMHASGRAGRRHREVVDQVAAVLILETALDLERSTGRPPGRPVTPRTPKESRA